MTIKIRKAIFPVGGLGTRFLPATKALPKEMLPVIDKPLLQFAVEEALEAGIEQFIFVTGRGKSAIEDHFDYSYELNETLKARNLNKQLQEINASVLEPGQISYVRQQNPLGLGHAVWCARHLIDNEPFAVILADDLILGQTPCLKQMIEAYQENHCGVIAAMDVPRVDVGKYGIIDIHHQKGNHLYAKGLAEKPLPEKAPSTYAVIGRYILSPQVLMHLSKQEKGASGEIQLTDAIAKMIHQNNLCCVLFEGTRYDCGSKEGMLRATIDLALSRDDLKNTMKRIIQESLDK